MTVNTPIHFAQRGNQTQIAFYRPCRQDKWKKGGGQIVTGLPVSKCRQTSVCNSPHSWHWQHSHFQAVFSLSVGLLSSLQLTTHAPSPVQDTQTNTMSASTSRASERRTTSQCNELQPVHRPQGLATDDTRRSKGNQQDRVPLLHSVQT